MKQFSFEMMAGNIKAMMKQIEASSADLWKVDPKAIKFIEGYNPRIKNERYKERVRKLADSIKANGFYNDHPLKCYVAEEEKQLVLYLVAGHRRLEGALLAIEEGHDLPFVPVVIMPRGAGEDEMNADLVIGNDGDPLTMYEQAIVAKRFSLNGYEPGEIAIKLNFKSGSPYVNDLLMLITAPIELRKFVENELITGTEAIRMLKKHGKKAAEMVRDALAKNAGAKVTRKNLMPTDAITKQVTKQAPALYAVVNALKTDAGYLALSPEFRTQLDTVMQIIADAAAAKAKGKKK